MPALGLGGVSATFIDFLDAGFELAGDTDEVEEVMDVVDMRLGRSCFGGPGTVSSPRVLVLEDVEAVERLRMRGAELPCDDGAVRYEVVVVLLVETLDPGREAFEAAFSDGTCSVAWDRMVDVVERTECMDGVMDLALLMLSGDFDLFSISDFCEGEIEDARDVEREALAVVMGVRRLTAGLPRAVGVEAFPANRDGPARDDGVGLVTELRIELVIDAPESFTAGPFDFEICLLSTLARRDVMLTTSLSPSPLGAVSVE